MPIPTADQVAHAIVAASRLCGENPIKVATNIGNTRARAYAAAAIKSAFGLENITAAWLVGQRGHIGARTWLRVAPATAWFDHSLMSRVMASIPGVQAPVQTTTVAPQRRDPRPPARSTAVLDLGDLPPPGRSALDQKRAAEAAAAQAPAPLIRSISAAAARHADHASA